MTALQMMIVAMAYGVIEFENSFFDCGFHAI